MSGIKFDKILGKLREKDSTGGGGGAITVDPIYFSGNGTVGTPLSFKQKNNLNATTVPGVGNDSSQGYQAGANASIWFNKNTADMYICTSAAVGAATWVHLSNGSVIVTTVAGAQVLVAGGSLIPGQQYLITNAHDYGIGRKTLLLIRAYDDQTFCESGTGLFRNLYTFLACLGTIYYSISSDTIHRVIISPYPDTKPNDISQYNGNAIDIFPFDNTDFTGNIIDDAYIGTLWGFDCFAFNDNIIERGSQIDVVNGSTVYGNQIGPYTALYVGFNGTLVFSYNLMEGFAFVTACNGGNIGYCTFGRNTSFDNSAIIGYNASSNTLRAGYSDFTIDTGQYAGVNPDLVTGMLNMAAFSWAGRLTGITHNLVDIKNWSRDHSHTLYPAMGTSMLVVDKTTSSVSIQMSNFIGGFLVVDGNNGDWAKFHSSQHDPLNTISMIEYVNYQSP